MVSVQEIKKQDTTTILADIVGLSTDEKPTTLGGKSVANGSTFVEMNTSDIYLYDQQNEEWKKFSGGSGGGGGGSSESDIAKFELTLNESYQYETAFTPKDILDALKQGKLVSFYEISGDFDNDDYVYQEEFRLNIIVKDFEEGGDNQYKIEVGNVTVGSTKAGCRAMVFVSSALNETFVFSKAVF